MFRWLVHFAWSFPTVGTSSSLGPAPVSGCNAFGQHVSQTVGPPHDSGDRIAVRGNEAIKVEDTAMRGHPHQLGSSGSEVVIKHMSDGSPPA